MMNTSQGGMVMAAGNRGVIMQGNFCPIFTFFPPEGKYAGVCLLKNK